MTNDGMKSIWMIDKSSLLFAIWMCEKWRSGNLSSCLLYQTPYFYFLRHYPLSQLKVDFLRCDLLICDAFGLPPLSICPLCALSKAQGCLRRHLLTLFETCSDSLCLEWVNLYIYLSRFPCRSSCCSRIRIWVWLQMQSGSTDYWISNLWCLSARLPACHGRWFQLIVKLPMTVCGTFVLEFAPWAGLRLSACSCVGWQSKGKRKSYARVERLGASSKSICDAPAYP